MAQQNIDFGSFPDDPDADAIRTAFQKVQQNFNELYATTTAGSVTSVNRGAGIDVNSPTGNVIVTANLAQVVVNTTSLSVGRDSNGGTSANVTSSIQSLVIDINPVQTFSNNFAGVYNVSTNPYSLSNITGILTANANSQPNITSVGTLTSLAVTGNVTSGNVYANSGTIGANLLTGTLTTAAQPNITSVGTLGNLNVTSNSNLGNLATANFFSGDGYLLSNLTISAGSSIVNGNSNVVVGANSNVTTSVAGNANIVVVTGTGANINGYLTVTGNITSANANLGNAVTANYFIGSGANLSSIVGANVSGAVGLATYATSANAVAGANVSGQVSYAATANSVAGANVSGAVSYATTANSVAGANVSGAVTYATTANSVAGANVSGQVANALVAGTVYTNAQPNITSVGTLGNLNVTGNSNLGNLATANFFSGDGGLLSNITIAAGSSIVNGNSNVSIAANGNVTTSVAGNANILTVTGTGVNVTGTLNATGSITGNFSGNVTNATQGNITSLGTLTGLTVNGLTNLGPVGNITITGGSANYFLMTNGSGTLTWTNAALVPAPGSNTQVIFNDGGTSYGANANLTFNKTTGLLTATLLGGTLTTAAQPNITSIGTLTGLTVNGTMQINGPTIANGTFNTGNANANIITANYYIGNGSNLSGIAGGNVSGAVAYATTANSVAGANVSGAVGLATYATTANSVAGANVSGAVTYATTANSVAGANVSGTVSSATTAGTVTTAAQPNITSVGTLTSLTVSGNISSANLTTSGYTFASVGTGISAAGTVQGNATVIAKQINVVSTVASGAGVVLPAAVAGMTIYITNTTANSLLVYPASGGAINSLATNAALTQAANSTIHYIAPTTTQWYSVGATYA